MKRTRLHPKPRRSRWALLFLAAYAMGCAAGWVDPDGNLHGAAIGEGSKLERCTSIPIGEAGVLTSAPLSTACSRVEGGPILPSLLELAGSALGGIAKVIASLFAWGA